MRPSGMITADALKGTAASTAAAIVAATAALALASAAAYSGVHQPNDTFGKGGAFAQILHPAIDSSVMAE